MVPIVDSELLVAKASSLVAVSALLTMLSAVNSFDSSWFAVKKNRLFSGVKEELLVTSEGRNPRV